MSVSYKKLFEMLHNNNLKPVYLRKNGLNPKVVDALTKNKNVNVSTIMQLCALFNCQPNDIMEYVPDTETADTKDNKQSWLSNDDVLE